MSQDQKIVSCLPVEELWAGQRLISTMKIRDLNASDIVALLRSDSVRFVVADIGRPLEWIPNNEKYDFWKDEEKARLAAPESKAQLENFHNGYCYYASEWKSYIGVTIVLLSKEH